MNTRVLPVLLLTARVGCEKAANSSSSSSATTQAARTYPYTVVTTVGMVGDIVQQVAGDKAKVSSLMGAGVDPHLYKPTRNDIAALMSADAVFYSGLVLEGKMTDTFVKIKDGNKVVLAVTDEDFFPRTFLLEPPEFQGHYDPHVWMAVQGWMKAVDAVVAGLSNTKCDAANASYYKDNAAKYQAELKKLDDYARKSIASIPKEQRILITAHDAFNYFGREYGIEVKGIQGISTESEAGLQQINALVNLLKERKIRAVFVESSVAEKNVRALVEGAAQKAHKVEIGGTLFSDAMGSGGTYEGTYIGMIDHNVTVITRALGGEAPEKGMQGKLK